MLALDAFSKCWNQGEVVGPSTGRKSCGVDTWCNRPEADIEVTRRTWVRVRA
jgi:hypothetical protein